MHSIYVGYVRGNIILWHKRASILLSLCFILYPVYVQAHPGRTDRNGGHYVRTGGWGYPIGSYHYHNGGSAVDSDTEYNKGYNDGYKKGYTYDYNENYREYTFYHSNDYYKDGYEKGFDEGFNKGLAAKALFRENQLKEDYNKGMQNGLNISLPSTAKIQSYSEDIERQRSYEVGYKEGIQKVLKEDYNNGLTDGSKVVYPSTESTPMYSKDAERQSQYEKGFIESVGRLIQNDYNFGYKEGIERHLNEPMIYSNDIKERNPIKKDI
jgi:flagellar biosynthesis/type III secretory pathway protein FliH